MHRREGYTARIRRIDPSLVDDAAGDDRGHTDADDDRPGGATRPDAALTAVELHVDSALWIAAGVGVAYVTDLVGVLRASSDVGWPWLYAAAVAVAAAVSVVLYLQYALPWVWGVRIPRNRWEVVYPYAFPVASVLWLCAGAGVVVGLWGAYGLLTLPVVFFVGMASVTVLMYL